MFLSSASRVLGVAVGDYDDDDPPDQPDDDDDEREDGGVADGDDKHEAKNLFDDVKRECASRLIGSHGIKL